MLGKKLSLVVFLMIVLVAVLAETVQANKSVFIISKHLNPSHAQAYAIDGNEVTYQTDVDISTYNTYDQGAGAVGNAVWPEKGLMFVTYEGSPIIVWASTKTLQKIGEFNTGFSNLGGIVVDTDKQKIYVVRRYSTELYVYSWDDVQNTIVLEVPNDPNYPARKYHALTNTTNAHGLALDETNDLLYVSTDTKTVHVYDTNDWSHDHYIDIEVGGTDRSAVGIAVDPNRGFLYTGDWDGHYYLVRTNTTSPYTSSQKYVGHEVIGLDVDEETGLVYCTTYHHDLRVYDSNLSLQDTEPNDIYGPAGVAVGGLYKPPFPLVTLVKDDNDVDCVSPLISEAEHELYGTPYNWLYYNIHYDANGFADTNVFITDHLPDEVDYNSSDPNGYYDPDKRTVTWVIPIMSASDSNTYRIQVGVNYYAKPGHTITNLCEIESDRYYKYTTIDTNVCCYGWDIIYVDADANDPNSYHNGTSWLHAYKDLQEALHTARTCGCEQIWVAEGTYKPTKRSARSISFELVDNVAVYGGFPPGGGTWIQRNPKVYETILSGDIRTPDYQSDNSYHVVKCQDVNNAILDGFIITAGKADALGSTNPNQYGGGIYCKDSNGLIVRNCSISINSAKYGGGMYNEFSSANITNCIFFDNEATYDNGGAIYNTNSSEPNVTNCIFSNNSARKGGAVYNNYSEPNITNCVFIGNTADYYGGGMDNSDESSPTIINCTFSGNSATTVGNSYGGAICNWNNSDPNVINCTFIDNSAHEGGAVYNYYYSDPNIANCIFTANNANMGGGLYNNFSSPNMTNCIFVGNTADSYGGGMYNYYESYPAVVNSIFSGNRADICGGGIFNCYNDNNSFELTNCTVSGNSASDGGGIYSWYFADTNITNCIFWGNVADVNDEIYNDSNTCDLSVTYSDVNGGWTGKGNINEDPCFFEVEQPDGSWSEDVFYDSSTFQSTLTDSDANWAVNELAGKFISPNTPQLLQFFIVSNNVNTIKVWSDVNDITGEGDTYHIYDYHLTVDSPCVDTGDPNGDYTGQKDIDGEPRVFDGDYNDVPIVDMGADEYYWSPADINSDGFVNFFDYAFFSAAWQSDPNKENYNEDCDLEDNNSIDYNDIALFCEDWLWQTAWAKAFPSAYDEVWGRSMGMGMGEGFFPSIQAKQAQPQLTPADIEEIIKWLAELWLTDEEVRKVISEDEWLKFIEAVRQSAKQLIYN